MRFLAEPGFKQVCDLPESGGYRRWLVVGALAQDARQVATQPGLELGYAHDRERDAELPGLVVRRVTHGA